jgi:hypothetical protein
VGWNQDGIILKSTDELDWNRCVRRAEYFWLLPCGAWIETILNDAVAGSLPARGEWIETQRRNWRTKRRLRRSPYGSVGWNWLKTNYSFNHQSFPTGAWIETCTWTQVLIWYPLLLPARGSGLKQWIRSYVFCFEVAPREHGLKH